MSQELVLFFHFSTKYIMHFVSFFFTIASTEIFVNLYKI